MLFTWRAVYSDGSYLEEGKYPDIDRTRLVEFLLLDVQKQVRMRMHLFPGQKLIYRKRRLGKLAPATGEIIVTGTIHVVGFHENRQGTNVQMLSFLFPDGHIELMDRFRADKANFEPFGELMEAER